MRKTSICMIAILLFGCSTVTTIELPEGDLITVKSRRNSLVRMSSGEMKFEIDNRGKPTFIEQLLSMMVVNGDWLNKAVED